MASKSWIKDQIRYRTILSTCFQKETVIYFYCKNDVNIQNHINRLSSYLEDLGIGFQLDKNKPIIKLDNGSEVVFKKISENTKETNTTIIYEDEVW